MPDLTATPGTDGERVEALLTHAISSGSALLRRLATEALKRRLRAGQHQGGGQLFDDREQLDLARHIASATAAADLLGRQRIRRRLLRAVPFAESTPFDADQEWLRKLLTPRAALDWFQTLDPLKVNPDLFELQHEGQGFQLAATTDREVLSKVFDVVRDRMETGKSVSPAPQAISRLLTDAGIEHNSGYAANVFRTNTMESYRTGAWKEFQDPDLEATFPVWKYIGVKDGRQRQGPEPKYPNHRIHCGKYWPRSVDFKDVRGREGKDVYQCRCDFLPINKYEWERLQEAGVKLETWP